MCYSISLHLLSLDISFISSLPPIILLQLSFISSIAKLAVVVYCLLSLCVPRFCCCCCLVLKRQNFIMSKNIYILLCELLRLSNPQIHSILFSFMFPIDITANKTLPYEKLYTKIKQLREPFFICRIFGCCCPMVFFFPNQQQHTLTHTQNKSFPLSFFLFLCFFMFFF